MQLTHIPLNNLKPAAVNVRKHGGKEIADLLPSIRSLGLIQPLLVRPTCPEQQGSYEIVAGQRRYRALCELAEEGESDPVPCVVMEDGDDAVAVEASLAENVARLPMDEIDQYKAFAALMKAGLGPEEIAARFGVTERLVRQRLAVANLIGPVLTAYRREEIDAGTVRTLTMASKTQQKKWLDLHRSKDDLAPKGRALRQWLLGGASVPVAHALFDVEASGLATISDLFGEEVYFADSEAFWPLQSAAVAEIAEAHRAKGWADVIVHEIGEHWPSWTYTDAAKKDGGEVHIAIASDGEVSIHAGVIAIDTLRKRQKANAAGDAAPERPELTKAMQRYLDLHRHAAVRFDLLSQPGLALRLAVAQMIVGSGLWSVEAEA
ncbi:MAG: ParB/RepB/Spo0J family partition protein [Pseudomonadota bacterium]